MMSAVKVAAETGMDVMPHVSCRDKNVIGMGAAILGAHMSGIRNILVVTGDPVPSGNRDMITPVYDFNSVRLINYIRQMNEEYFQDEPIACGGALNYGRILCGILPLVSYRNAMFMKNEVPGVHIPDEIVERYDKDMSRADSEQVGIEIAAEIAEKLSEVADGYYFMVPFNRASMIAEIMKRMRKKCLI